jgi:membrane fusion protein, multidrug efflux system
VTVRWTQGGRGGVATFGVSLVASLAAIAVAGPAPDGGMRFDCVIEPNEIVEVGSPIEGVLEEVAVDRGDTVKEGQLLARLDARVEYAELAVARARARAESGVEERKAVVQLSARARERAEDLYERKVISDQVKDQSDTDAAVARAQLKQAEELRRIAALDVWRATEAVQRRVIRSPINGIVVSREMSPGERISEQHILTIAQIDPLRVEAIVPADNFGKIVQGQTVVVLPEAPAQGEYQAKVTIVDRIIDPASGTFRVRAELPNPDGKLPSGLRCQMSLAGGAAPAPAPKH